jgi:hypothetical protein
VNKQDELQWEARWARPVAAAAFLAAVLLLGHIVLLQTFVENRPAVDALPDFLLSIDENPGTLIGARLAQGLAALLLIGVFLYLFRAVQAREGGIPSWFVYLIVAGPLLYAIGQVWGALEQTEVAKDFADGRPIRGTAGDERADNLLEDRANVAVFAVSLAGQVALAFLFVMLPLRARRVGLLSPFMGILGVITGALIVLQILGSVGLVIEAFWLGALGMLVLGAWPGGRGPAWESGEAEPWPTPAQRRGLEPEREGESLLDPSDSSKPPEPEPVPERPASRKRRRKP